MCFHFECHTPATFQKKFILTTDNLITLLFVFLSVHLTDNERTLLPLQVKLNKRDATTANTNYKMNSKT